MPLNDLFTYRVENKNEGNIKAIVTIHEGHPLFEGHFPGQPVTPGVVLIEIIRKVLSDMLDMKLMLSSAREIKFVSAVIPTIIKEIELSIEYKILQEAIETTCVFSGEGQIFTKLRGEFREV